MIKSSELKLSELLPLYDGTAFVLAPNGDVLKYYLTGFVHQCVCESDDFMYSVDISTSLEKCGEIVIYELDFRVLGLVRP